MIVIPMAGLSARFARAGYDRPKFMLPLGTDTVFDHALSSFAGYFRTLPFLLVLRDDGPGKAFAEQRCAALGIGDLRIVSLDRPTAGQAETVHLGLEQAGIADATPLTIFNIDTFRPGFAYPQAPWCDASDGYLEVFRGSGANWSYVRPDATHPPAVLETAEKRPLSDLCCTGLYHFQAAGDFRQALADERGRPSAAELYVAPLYNHLIARGKRIHYELVDTAVVQFCGVPDEYLALGGLPPTGTPSVPLA